MAKPRKPVLVNWDLVRSLMRIHCTEEEICSVAGIVDINMLARLVKRDHGITLQEFYKKELRYGNVSIRRAQWKLAVEELDGPMLRFLGNQLLGQEQTIKVTPPPVSGQFGGGGVSGPLIQIIVEDFNTKDQSAPMLAERWYDFPIIKKEEPGPSSSNSERAEELHDVVAVQATEVSTEEPSNALVPSQS